MQKAVGLLVVTISISICSLGFPVRAENAYQPPKKASVVGGDLVAPDEFFSKSVVGVANTSGGSCSGSVIAPLWILTAAHCVTSGPSHTSPQIDPSNLFVVFGAYQSPSTNGVQAFQTFGYRPDFARRVVQIVRHPGYRQSESSTLGLTELANDLALVRIESSIPGARPVILSSTPLGQLPVKESVTELTIAGYGLHTLDGQRVDGLLRKGQTKFQRFELTPGPLPRTERAIRHEGDVVSNSGDSGGPTFLWIRNRLVQIGVHSYGSITQTSNGVSTKKYSADVAVGDQFAWIAWIAAMGGKPVIQHENLLFQTSGFPTDSTPMFRAYLNSVGIHYFTPNLVEYDGLVRDGWNGEGLGFFFFGADKAQISGTFGPAQEIRRLPVIHLYNPNTSQHYYTSSDGEASELERRGWQRHGVQFAGINGTLPGCFVEDSSRPGANKEIFKFYNPNTGQHFFTTNAAERGGLQEHTRLGYGSPVTINTSNGLGTSNPAAGTAFKASIAVFR